MEYAQLGVWGNIPWKYELNPFSGLGGDMKTSFDNETKTDGQMDKHTDKRTNERTTEQKLEDKYKNTFLHTKI